MRLYDVGRLRAEDIEDVDGEDEDDVDDERDDNEDDDDGDDTVINGSDEGERGGVLDRAQEQVDNDNLPTLLRAQYGAALFCFVLYQKFRLPSGLHSSCSISPTASGTCRIPL